MTAETLGIALFGSYQKRDSAAASATSNDWNIRTLADFLNPANGFVNAQTQITNAPTNLNTLISVPNDSRYHWSTSTRERINGQAVLQFKPFDALTLTADGLYAQTRVHEQRTDQTNWFNRPFNKVTFDSNPVVATTVFLQENENPVKDLGFEQQYRAAKDRLWSFGLNAQWEITDSLRLNLDGYTSKASSRPDAADGASSTLVSFGAPVVANHSVDFSGGIPGPEVHDQRQLPAATRTARSTSAISAPRSRAPIRRASNRGSAGCAPISAGISAAAAASTSAAPTPIRR